MIIYDYIIIYNYSLYISLYIFIYLYISIYYIYIYLPYILLSLVISPLARKIDLLVEVSSRHDKPWWTASSSP